MYICIFVVNNIISSHHNRELLRKTVEKMPREQVLCEVTHVYILMKKFKTTTFKTFNSIVTHVCNLLVYIFNFLLQSPPRVKKVNLFCQTVSPMSVPAPPDFFYCLLCVLVCTRRNFAVFRQKFFDWECFSEGAFFWRISVRVSHGSGNFLWNSYAHVCSSAVRFFL